MASAGASEILNIVAKLIENDDVKVNLTSSGKAALVAGLCTMAGGLMGGSVGITVGGLAASLLNTYLTPNHVPLSQLMLSGLSEEDKTSLAQLLQSLVRGAPGAAVAGILSNDGARAAAIQAVVSFVQSRGLVVARRKSSSSFNKY